MDSQEELTRLTTGSYALTPARLAGVPITASANTFTQTYSTANKTIHDPRTSLGGSDYGSDFAALSTHLEEIVQNINAIVDALQSHGLIG